ncbi:Protein Wnt-8a Precursor [Larimichthys crocea]|uniref:Protein Wnt n=1 Tax=Larimichthys crocea TaxID=215358 RepID=A0A6G0I4J1_LARCR|nr:Protein Wnt-8a Precursor [Larimichthys crocea]
MQLSDFREIGNYLKIKHSQAQKLDIDKKRMRAGNSADNRGAIVDSFGSIAQTELIYLEDSPDYCKKNISSGLYGTEGRECVQHGEGLTQWERRSCRRLCHECGLRVEEKRTEETSMSFSDDLSKVEVMGWSPQSLADYMRRLKLTNCDKVVMKGNISGAQFLQMTDFDLQVFPKLYISILTKIQNDLNKGEQKKAFLKKPKTPQYPKQVIVQEEELSNSDEFESGSDYEDPQEDGEDSYIFATDESQTTEQQHSEESSEEECEQPPLPSRPRLPPKVPELQDSREGSTVIAPGSSTSKPPQPRPPKATDVSRRESKLIPPPPVPTQPAVVTNPTPGPRGGLDPVWYKGNVTRHQAEAALRQMNQDGVFLVRDSSHGSGEHPYTLMILKRGKIYNIKIRYQGDFYSLGTGHYHNKCFPGVKEMITHHTHTPLVLIDATDQSSEAHSHCCLLHPVGL